LNFWRKNVAQSYAVQSVAEGFSLVTRKTITGRISMIITVAESVWKKIIAEPVGSGSMTMGPVGGRPGAFVCVNFQGG
jgi:hypothetical protein